MPATTTPTIGTITHGPPGTVTATALATLVAAVDRIACGFPAEALPSLEVLAAEYPDWAVARAYLGTAYVGVTRVEPAREALEAAVALAPESFICRLRFAEFLARMGQYGPAVAELDVALHVPAPDAGARDAAVALRAFCLQRAHGEYYRETPDLRSRFQPWFARLMRRPAASGASADR